MLNVYLYSVTSISLTTFYIAAIVLVNGLLRLWLGVDIDEEAGRAIAGGAGFAMVSLPLWWVHWRWLRWQFRQTEAPDTMWHRFYLFTVICLNAIVILIAGSVGLANLISAALGVSETTTRGLINAGTALCASTLALSIWLHHWRQFSGLGQLLPDLSFRAKQA